MTRTAPDKSDAENVRFVGYARVSTEDQSLELQIQALKKMGVLDDNLFQEKLSATKKDRQELDAAMADLRPGDTLVVWKLDRLARSQYEFLSRLAQIDDAGAKLKSIVEPFDFGTPTGRLVLNTLIGVAQFESEITRQRTKAGIAARKAKGLPAGAPVKMTPENLAEAKRMLNIRTKEDRMTVGEVAAHFGVAPATIYSYFARNKAFKWPLYIRKEKP